MKHLVSAILTIIASITTIAALFVYVRDSKIHGSWSLKDVTIVLLLFAICAMNIAFVLEPNFLQH